MTARWAVLTSCCVVALASGRAVADERTEARTIIDQAIEFAGGREALARYERPFVCLREGTAMGGNGPEAFKMKVLTHLPDKLRTDQTSSGGRKFNLVFNGEKGWNKSSGPPVRTFGPPKVGAQEMNPVQTKNTRERLYAQWLSTLLPLDDEAFRLSMVAEITTGNRTAVGVNIARQDRPDVQLYFDKETFAPVKSAYKVNGLPSEEFYDDYAELDGLVYPKKSVLYGNGKKLHEMQTTELKFLDAAEKGAFDKP